MFCKDNFLVIFDVTKNKHFPNGIFLNPNFPDRWVKYEVLDKKMACHFDFTQNLTQNMLQT